jgi:hypothetical protein
MLLPYITILPIYFLASYFECRPLVTIIADKGPKKMAELKRSNLRYLIHSTSNFRDLTSLVVIVEFKGLQWALN